MNKRVIADIICKALKIEALCMIPAAIISAACSEIRTMAGFLAAIALITACVFAVSRRPASGQRALHAGEGFAAVALSWVALSLFGSVPLLIAGSAPTVLDAVFETVSGFTTTGATVISDVESLPDGILYWRSFTNWLGGMGVLVFMMAVLPMSKNSGSLLHLLRAESTGPTVSKLVPRLSRSARILYVIYISLTASNALLFMIGGMPFFDSVLNAFSIAGTGGFAISNASFAAYNSIYLQTVAAVFMALCGVNFSMIYLLFIKDIRHVFKNEELRLYLGIMVGSAIIIALYLAHSGADFLSSLGLSFFHVVSVMSSTGFVIADLSLWPQFTHTMLIILMIIGSCAGSTGGGIKAARVLTLFKCAKNQFERLLHPRGVNVVMINGKVVDDRAAMGVSVFMSVYVAIAAASLIIISLDGFPFEMNVTAVISMLSNVGPDLGMTGAVHDFSAFSPLSKVVFMLDMLLGRLEIFPMIVLFMPTVWRRSRG